MSKMSGGNETTTSSRTTTENKELEELKEKNYRLHLKMENMKQTYTTEIDYLKDEIQIKATEAKTSTDKLKSEMKLKETDLNERIAILTEDNHQLKDGTNVLKGQVDQLQRTVEQFKGAQVEKNGRSEQFEALKINYDQLNIELKSTRQILEMQQSKVYELQQCTEQQKEMLNKLNEDMESKDECISQLQLKMKTIEAEHEEDLMQMQLNIINNQTQDEASVDPNKRGNSLFSEVEQRRERVEEELIKLRKHNARLNLENFQLQSQIEKGDCRSAIILTQLELINKSQTDFEQEIKKMKTETNQLYEMYRDRFEALRHEYKRKLMLYRDGVLEPQLGEMEQLRENRDNLLSENLSISRELNDLRKELKHLNLLKIESDANIKIFRIKLQAAQENYCAKLDPDSKSKKSPNPNSPSTTGNSPNLSGNNNADWLHDEESSEQRHPANAFGQRDRNQERHPFGTTTRNQNLKSTNSNANKASGGGAAGDSGEGDDFSKKSHMSEEQIPGCNQQ